MSIQQLKADEFQRRVYEISDEIVQGKVKSVTLSEVQLEFYEVELTVVMKTFLSFLEQLQGPTHPEDQQMIWKVYADKHGDKYRLKFTQRLEVTNKS
jgi:hypothetical protein